MNESALAANVWRLTVVVVAVAVVALLGSLLVGAAVSGAAGPFAGGADGDQRHIDPDTAPAETSLSPLERQLSSEFTRRAESGALNLSDEEYEQAREQVSDERYEQLLQEYQDIAGETGQEDRAELVIGAQRAYRSYLENASAYQADYRRYQLLTGDDDPAAGGVAAIERRNGSVVVETPRAVARTLEEREQAVNESALDAVQRYKRLQELDGENRTSIITSINQSSDDISGTQATVRAEQFTETSVTLQLEEATISPTRPLVTSGQLTTVDGEPLGNETMRLVAGNQTLRTTTNEVGVFAVEYTPTQLPANTTELRFRYEPPAESPLLGSETTVDVDVERVEPTVTVTATPDVVAYNQTVQLSGNVTAEGEGLPDVPYLVTADGTVLYRGTTDVAPADEDAGAVDFFSGAEPDGQNDTGGETREGEPGQAGDITGEFRLPADVAAGETELRVQLPLAERAVEQAETTTTVRVEEQETSLSIATEPMPDGTVAVDGALTTAAGDAVSGQSVTLRVDGEAVGSATTAENGTFARQILVPDGAGEGGSATVTAIYDSPGTNLGSTRAESRFPVATSGRDLPALQWPLLGFAGLVVLVGGYVLVRRRRRGGSSVESVSSDGDETPIAPSDVDVSAGYLETAATLLEEGRETAAVEVSYGALRQGLAGDDAREQTHWEFYQSYRNRLDDEAAATLRRVTEQYERSRFAAETVDAEAARTVLDAVEALVEDDEQYAAAD